VRIGVNISILLGINQTAAIGGVALPYSIKKRLNGHILFSLKIGSIFASNSQQRIQTWGVR
jgi:hypothetical protein